MIELSDKAHIQRLIQTKLLEHGPMTVAQIAEDVRISRRTISGAISLGRKKYGPALFVIVGYERRTGIQGREAPIYAIPPEGAEVIRDARRPSFTDDTHRQRQGRYRDKMRAVIRLRINARRAAARGNVSAS